MKIGAISELSQLNGITFDEISSVGNKYFIEVSEKNDTNDFFNSKKYDLYNCMYQIGLLISGLQADINRLSNSIKDTRDNYLPLSGGNLTGPLAIGNNNQPIIDPLKIFAGSDTTAIKTNIPTIEFGDEQVYVDNQGILHCTNDIDGCALTAKWS